jgi:hypothetical protein
VSFEAGFVAVYAVGLLLVAGGLFRLGRVSTSPWRSRVLAAYRDQAPEPLDAEVRTDWPHSEVARLHTAAACVASTAATLLSAAELARQHHALDVLALGSAAFAGSVVTALLLRRMRT